MTTREVKDLLDQASESDYGVAKLAADGATTAGLVVQASDARLTAADGLAAHLSDAVAAHAASAILAVPGGVITGTTVQDALDELAGGAALAGETHAATSKATPVNADELPLVDSAASFALKRLTWANLKATLKTYFDTLYPAPNADTTGKSAKTDALNSATTVVNVSAAIAPTAGQVLTATDGTHAAWQAPSGGTPDAADVAFTPAAGIAATDVQAAIVEDAGDLAAHLADAADAHAASAIGFSPTGAIAATTVQAALAELDSEKSATGHTHTSGDVTDFTEAAQDVVGALVAAAGGSYNDGAGTITFPAAGAADVAAAIHGATSKATPVDADELGLADSAASFGLKKLTWANLKATAKSYFDTLYQPTDADLTTIAGLTATTDSFLQAKSSAWAARTIAQVKSDLGVGAGRLPWAYTYGLPVTASLASQIILAANGGSAMIPIVLEAELRLDSLVIRNNDTSGSRPWEWRLYADDGSGSATLSEVAGANGSETFTASIASSRTSQVGSPPVTVPAGMYWLVVRNTHATNTWIIGGATAGTLSGNFSRTKTLGSALGSTLDLSTGWSASTVVVGARLTARILGEASSL